MSLDFIKIYQSFKLTFLLILLTLLSAGGLAFTSTATMSAQPSTLSMVSLSNRVEPIQGQPPAPNSNQNPPAKDKALELVGYLAGLGQGGASSGGTFDIAGDILYLVANETDIRVINIADPAQPHEVSLYPTGMPLAKIVIWDQYAFVAGTEGLLQILDISNPLKLREVGRYHPPISSIKDMTISGNTLYLASGENGLRILDISTPIAPLEIGRYEAASATHLALAGQTLHLLGWEWHILDITDPATPKPLTVTPALGTTFMVKERYAYFHRQIDANSGAVVIVDITNPAAPVQLKPEAGGIVGTGRLGSVETAGHYLFHIGINYNLMGYISMVDLSIPTRPINVGEYQAETIFASVKVMGDDTLYVSGREGELWIFHFQPVTLPQATARVICPNYLGAGVGAVFVRDHYAYVGVGPKLAILDVSTPGSPVEIGQTVLLGRYGYIKDIEVVGSLAYVVSDDGLRVVDVSDLTAPVQLSFLPLPGQGEAISMAGDYAYIIRRNTPSRSGSGCGTSGTLYTVDISDPLAPQLTNAFDTAGGNCSAAYYPYEVIASNNYLYVADSDSYGLRVFDTSNPAQPVELGNSGGWTEDMIIKDGYAYVSNGYWMDFRILDISDPTSFKQVALYETSSSTGPMAMAGQIIYLAEDPGGPLNTPGVENGLRLLDVSSPTSPTAVGFYPTAGPVRDITIANGYAYLIFNDQLHILDVSEPTAPIEVGIYGQSYAFNHFTPAGNDLYLADNKKNALQLIDASQPFTPTIVTTATINTENLVKVISRPPYVYVVEQKGLHIFTLADPTTLAELSFYPMEADLLADAAITGDYAYLVNLGNNRELVSLDISNPAKPTGVSRYDLPPGSGEGTVVQAEDYLYFRYQNDKGITGLLALSLANPSAPAEIDHLKVMAGSLVARGDYAYITNAAEGLQVLEVSASPNSVRIQHFPELTGHSLVFKNDYGYLVTNSEGLRLLDLSAPARPVEAGVVGLGLEGTSWGGLQSAAIGDDYVYLLGYYALHAINISEPTTPYEAGYNFIPDQLQAITLVDSYSYLTNVKGDLFICQVEEF